MESSCVAQNNVSNSFTDNIEVHEQLLCSLSKHLEEQGLRIWLSEEDPCNLVR